MVKVLRDDLKADQPPEPRDAYGIGYTTLAWTRDGEHWTRDREKFFDRHPQHGAWDHAHAWIDEQVPVGDEVYLYYGGYKSGHKVNRFEERQIGLVKMKRDRYVAREAGADGGSFRTPLVQFEAASDDVEPGSAGRRGMRANPRRNWQTVARLHAEGLPSGFRGWPCGAGAVEEVVERAERQARAAGVLPEERAVVRF